MQFIELLLASLAHDNSGILLRRLRLRDPDALTEVYDLHGRLVYMLILRIVQNPAAAEDLVQESMLRLWNRASSLQEDYNSVLPWLLTIARNCALDYRKSARRVRWSNELDDQISIAEIEPDILASERVRHLEKGFKSLPAEQKQVLELVYFEGLTQTEIAAKLGEPVGTIKGRVRLALQKLKQHFIRQGLAGF